MTDQVSSREDKKAVVVLVLMNEGVRRKEIAARLNSEAYNVRFAHSYPEALESIVKHKTDALLHDWSLGADNDALHMHLKIAGSRSFNRMARLVLVPEIDPHMLAVSYDYSIDKMLQEDISEDEIVSSIALALKDREESADLDELLGDALNQEDYDQGVIDERILQAHQEHPENKRLRMEYSTLLIRRGALDEAERMACDLLKESPRDVRVMNLLSPVYLKQKRFDRANQVLSNADFLSPQNPERLVMIGDVFYEKGDMDSAETNYASALDMDPESRAAHNGLGMVHFSRGDAEKALECFRKCLSEDETASFFNNAAVLAIKSKKTSEALKLYETALRSLQTGKFAHLIFFIPITEINVR